MIIGHNTDLSTEINQLFTDTHGRRRESDKILDLLSRRIDCKVSFMTFRQGRLTVTRRAEKRSDNRGTVRQRRGKARFVGPYQQARYSG